MPAAGLSPASAFVSDTLKLGSRIGPSMPACASIASGLSARSTEARRLGHDTGDHSGPRHAIRLGTSFHRGWASSSNSTQLGQTVVRGNAGDSAREFSPERSSVVHPGQTKTSTRNSHTALSVVHGSGQIRNSIREPAAAHERVLRGVERELEAASPSPWSTSAKTAATSSAGRTSILGRITKNRAKSPTAAASRSRSSTPSRRRRRVASIN